MPGQRYNVRSFVSAVIGAILLSSMLMLPLQAQQSSEEASAAAPAEETVLHIELPERSGNGDLLDAIRQRGVLRVGISTFTPWAMHNKDGELIGFEVDVARQLADDLGVELQLVETSWSNIISDLLDGDYDIIASGLSITLERALLVEFSSAYRVSEMQLLASKSKVAGLSSKNDFNSAAMTIGARPGTTAFVAASRAFPEAELKPFDDDAALYDAVRNGEVAAVVASSPRPMIEAQRAPEQVYLPLIDEAGTHESLGNTAEAFAVRKGNQTLLNFLNIWILSRSMDSFLSDKDRYWFRSLAWEDQL